MSDVEIDPRKRWPNTPEGDLARVQAWNRGDPDAIAAAALDGADKAADKMLTEGRRCGQCGVAVSKVEGEPRMVDNGRGWLEAYAVDYVLTPCGHAFTVAVGHG